MREWALRSLPSTQRSLMYRMVHPDGTTTSWKDVAVFASYNDAEPVAAVLNASERRPASPTADTTGGGEANG